LLLQLLVLLLLVLLLVVVLVVVDYGRHVVGVRPSHRQLTLE
jgi:hypothetical protein